MSHHITLSSIKISPSHSPAAATQLSCFPSTFDPVRPGIRVHLKNYLATHPKPVSEFTAISSGPVLIQSTETTEIAWTERRNAEKTATRTHWLASAHQPGTLTLLLREIRPLNEPPRIEQTLVQFPSALQPGTEFTTEDLYFQGPLNALERLSHRVDGLFDFSCDACHFEAVRLTSWRPGSPSIKTEIFIDASSGLARFAWRLLQPNKAETSTREAACIQVAAYSDPWLCETFCFVEWTGI
jgi:hypothetical protein